MKHSPPAPTPPPESAERPSADAHSAEPHSAEPHSADPGSANPSSSESSSARAARRLAARVLFGTTLVCSLAGCPAPDPRYPGDHPGNYDASSPTDYLVQFLNDRYYWSDRVPPADARDYPSPQAALQALRVPEDRLGHVLAWADASRFANDHAVVGFGIGYRLDADRQSLQLHVVHEGSAADIAGLKRGERIVAIDAVPIATLLADGRLASLLEDKTVDFAARFTVANAEPITEPGSGAPAAASPVATRELMLRKAPVYLSTLGAQALSSGQGGRSAGSRSVRSTWVSVPGASRSIAHSRKG